MNFPLVQQPAPFDIARARADTPGCRDVIHLNNAGASLPTRQVLRRVTRHLEREGMFGGYEAEATVRDELEAVYEGIADLIDADSTEIALVDSATRAWAIAFGTIEWQSGDRIITSEAEYASNFIAFLQVKERYNVSICVVQSLADGTPDLAGLEALLDERVRLVGITHVPTDSGLINPVNEIGDIVRARSRALYLVDACQSLGQVPLSARNMKCDFLAATGRKFLRAPRGTGFLYAAQGSTAHLQPRTADLASAAWVEPDVYRMREDARRFSYWEANIASQLGMGEAVRYANELGIDAIWARVSALAERLRTLLAMVPGVRLHEDFGPRCGIVTFTCESLNAAEVSRRLRTLGINTWPVSRTASVLNMDRRGVREVVRASVHYYNDDEELERFAHALAQFGD